MPRVRHGGILNKLRSLRLSSIEDNLGRYSYPMNMDEWEAKWNWRPKSRQLTSMPPEMFLHLAREFTPNEASLEWLRHAAEPGEYGWPPMWMNVAADGPNKHRVLGHEGRHRAYIAKEKGWQVVPVILFHMTWITNYGTKCRPDDDCSYYSYERTWPPRERGRDIRISELKSQEEW